MLEGMCLWGLGLCGKSLVLPLNFDVDLKLLQKLPIKTIIQCFEINTKMQRKTEVLNFD